MKMYVLKCPGTTADNLLLMDGKILLSMASLGRPGVPPMLPWTDVPQERNQPSSTLNHEIKSSMYLAHPVRWIVRARVHTFGRFAVMGGKWLHF